MKNVLWENGNLKPEVTIVYDWLHGENKDYVIRLTIDNITGFAFHSKMILKKDLPANVIAFN